MRNGAGYGRTIKEQLRRHDHYSSGFALSKRSRGLASWHAFLTRKLTPLLMHNVALAETLIDDNFFTFNVTFHGRLEWTMHRSIYLKISIMDVITDHSECIRHG